MSTENLRSKEAIEKLKSLIDSIDIGMIGSYQTNSDFVYAVPMSRQEVDDEGNIWYILSSDSQTFKNIEANRKVSLLYSDIKSYTFLSVNGIGELSNDQARIDKYWNKMMEAWFEKGREDPSIRILKVLPSEGHYWDNKTNKLFTFLKVATSAITGKDMDIGREGDLKL